MSPYRVSFWLTVVALQAARIFGQATPAGLEFQVNTYTDRQFFPKVASDSRGNFVVAWLSDGSSATDTSAYSVQAQRYDGLFRDGFEIGSTARWSSAVP